MATAPEQAAPPGDGLRERKKRERRAAIARAALELFERQGVHGTTISQIAAAADVAPRTVFVHFPSKEDLLFPDAAERQEDLRLRLDRRAADESTVAVLRTWVQEVVSAHRSDADERRRRVIAAEIDLQSHEKRLLSAVNDMLVVSLARDLETGPDDVAASLAAAATIGALGAMRERFNHCKEAEREEAMLAEAMVVFDQALVFVDAGVRALRAHVQRQDA